MIILVATKEEYDLAKKYLQGFGIVRTGVGASNVIKTCSVIDRDEIVVNVGFAGSNRLPKGTIAKVKRTYRYLEPEMDGVIEEDYRQGYQLSESGYACYTSNSFVTESHTNIPVLYDMELNYIAAFPFKLIGSIKIVSDNLNLSQYEESINISEESTWKEVEKVLYEMLKPYAK